MSTRYSRATRPEVFTSDVNILSIGGTCLYEGREIKIYARVSSAEALPLHAVALCHPRAVMLPTPRFTNTDTGARDSLSRRGADKPEPFVSHASVPRAKANPSDKVFLSYSS